MKKNISKYLKVLAVVTILSGCADLDVPNRNEPSVVISTPDDYKGLVAGALRSINNLFTDYRGNTALEFAADHTTMTNNVNNWWSEFKAEPRAQFNNSLSNANRVANVDNQWALLSSAINSSLTVIRAIEDEGLQMSTEEDTRMTLACAYFAKGMAEGYMGITFDKGWVATNATDLATLRPSPYAEVVSLSVADLEKSIEIAKSGTFTVQTGFLPTPAQLSNVDLAKLASTYAAHFLMSGSRTKAQNDSNDWAKILKLAQGGITADYIHSDDGQNDYHSTVYISGLDWYFRVDHRIIKIFDPTYPDRFPNDVTVNSFREATNASGDKRFDLYFKYEPSVARFNLTRGPQLRSHYRIKRWDAYYLAVAVGDLPYFFKYVNDLMVAEALVMANNNIQGAVDILNAGNRITVGELPLLNAATLTKEDVLKIIWNERDIEICRTDWAISFMDARRRGILQKGCLLHFPIPATELLVMTMPLYSYGGQANADGINTSNGVGAWYTPPGVN